MERRKEKTSVYGFTSISVQRKLGNEIVKYCTIMRCLVGTGIFH
jgi:hypothetical protein